MVYVHEKVKVKMLLCLNNKKPRNEGAWGNGAIDIGSS
jgi:hypothetical protein